MRSHERQFKATLSALATHFIDRSWAVQGRIKDSLHLCCEPSHGVRHSLRVWEPVGAKTPAPDGLVYVNCKIFFSFVAIENLINDSLGYEQHSSNMISASLRLHELLPGRGWYDFYMLELEPDSSAPRIIDFLNDYDRLLVPIQSRMADESILLDPNFKMPLGDDFSWSMRRLAYLKLRTRSSQWRDLADEMELEALDVLNKVEPPDCPQPGIFTNVEAIRRDSERRKAEEVLRLITALRQGKHTVD